MDGKIKELENTYAANPTENEHCELRKYKLELNDLINKKTQFLIDRLRYNKFQFNNKSSKYLENLIKPNKEKTTITVIKDSAGKPLNDPKDTFRDKKL